MTLNLVTLALFAVNAVLINGTWNAPLADLEISLLLTGVGCLGVLGAGFYGWRMVSASQGRSTDECRAGGSARALRTQRAS